MLSSGLAGRGESVSCLQKEDVPFNAQEKALNEMLQVLIQLLQCIKSQEMFQISYGACDAV